MDFFLNDNFSQKRDQELTINNLEDAIFRQSARFFPSSSALATQVSSKRRKLFIPLLKEFLEEYEEEPSPSDDRKVEGKVEGDNEQLISIDHTSKSTLSKGQHERYLKLQDDRKIFPRSHPKQREFQKLHLLVKREQETYRKARQDFVVANAQRFLTGFRPVGSLKATIDYTNWHSQYSQIYIEEWKRYKFPLKYGKVSQKVSLSTSSMKKSYYQNQDELKNWNPMEKFHSKVVSGNTIENKSLTYENSLRESLPLNLPRKMQPPSVPCFIKIDSMALDLAKKYCCSAVVSVEALEEILTQTSWKIPLWNSDFGLLRLLDHPMPQPTLPRKCLTQGIQYTLQSGNSIQNSGHKRMYTLLQMQSEDSSSKPYRILVQSPARSTMTHQHVNLEYFPERGLEELTPQEQSLWILDSLLAPHFPIELLRVHVKENNTEWNIEVCETVSVSHALASSNEMLRRTWNRLLIVLNAVVDKRLPIHGDYLLVKESTDTMSLHCADENEPVINLENHFQTADVVKTSLADLLECARPWKWTSSDQIIDTFPLKTASLKKDK